MNGSNKKAELAKYGLVASGTGVTLITMEIQPAYATTTTPIQQLGEMPTGIAGIIVGSITIVLSGMSLGLGIKVLNRMSAIS